MGRAGAYTGRGVMRALIFSSVIKNGIIRREMEERQGKAKEG